MNDLVPTSSTPPALVAAAGERASMRFLVFFAANIRNPHTRRVYARAAEELLGWPASLGARSIPDVKPVHVATWITAYLKNGGMLEKAAAMANHAPTRTTQLYDRRRDEVSLDEVERIVI
jgi:hypothetical protein